MQLFNGPPRIIAQVHSAPLSPIVATVAPETIADKAKAAKHLDIDNRYAGKREKSRPSIVSLRVRDLQTFFRDKHDKFGAAMPEGCEDALDDFGILVNYTVQLGDYRLVRAIKARWMPHLGEVAFDALVIENALKPLYLSADDLGVRIGLDDATRTRLGITTIGAKDFGKAERVERAKHKNVLAEKARRLKAGATPHSESAARTKPWLALGMKRTKYYSERAKGTLRTDSLTPSVASSVYMNQSAAKAGASAPTDLARPRSDSGVERLVTELSAADAWMSVPGLAAGVDRLVAEPSAADDLIQSITKRDAAGAGRLRISQFKNSKNALHNQPLAALASIEMGRAAA
jgi:hypothetical protein